MAGQKTYRSFSELGESLGLPSTHAPSRSQHDGKEKEVRLILETHGRRGKTVTIVTGLQHNPDTMEEIAKILKQFCGTGGTVKAGTIELQGDQRVRAAVKLKELHYIVK